MGSRVYRFGDNVALSIPGNGETLYIDGATARKLCRALERVAKSCASETFADKTVGTVEIEIMRKK